MSTTAITPGGGAAPAAGSAAPPASTSAPASAPTTTGTESTGGGDGGGTSSTPTDGGGANLTVEERLAQGWKKITDKFAQEGGEGETATEEAPPAEGEGAGEGDVTEETAAAGEGEETPEGEGEQETPEGEGTEEPGETLSLLDDGTEYGPKQFSDFLADKPELKKALDADPDTKNRIYGALRRDTENREIRQIIPDVETAKAVSQSAAAFQHIDNRFLGATTPEGAKAFIETWVREALVTDDQGQPILKDGKYQFHPALSYTFDHIFDNKVSALREQAEKSGNERLQAALDVLREELSPDSRATEDMPEELRAQAAALDADRRKFQAEKDEANRQRLEQQTVASQQSIDRAEEAAAKSVQDQLKPLFAKATLSDFEKNAALEKIGDAIDAKLAEMPLYQSMYDSLLQREPSAEREKAITKHILKFTNEILGPIAAKIIREAKGGALTRQDAKQSQVDAQKQTSKTDPTRTSVAMPQKGKPADPKQLRETITKEYQAAHDGEMPDATYLLTEMAKRTGAFAVRK